MPISFACSCSKKLQVRDELTGKLVRCPGCGKTVRITASGDIESPPARTPPAAGQSANRRAKSPPFPVLGICIGWAAILVGCLLVTGSIVVTVKINSEGGEYKPAGLIVFGVPGILWAAFGGMLLGMRRRFVFPFFIFILVNMAVGVLFTTQARHLGGPGDARIFAMIGLGFLLGPIPFQLFHGFLMRDARRHSAATANGAI